MTRSCWTSTPGSTTPWPWSTWPRPAATSEFVGRHLHRRKRRRAAGGAEHPGPAGAVRPTGASRSPSAPRCPLAIPLVTTEETHGPQGIGYAELPPPAGAISARHAVDVWVEEARAQPGELTGLITGPLTNFALALRREPELPACSRAGDHGRQLLLPGQHHTHGRVERRTSIPHAAKEVFAAYRGLPEDKLPIVCALDTTERIEMRPEHLQRLAEEAAVRRAPELVLPEQPEGLRSTVRQPAGPPPVRCPAVLLRVPPALRPGLRGARPRLPSPPAWRPDTRTTHPAGDGGRRGRVAAADGHHRGRLPGPVGTPPNARIVAANNPEQCFDELMVRWAPWPAGSAPARPRRAREAGSPRARRPLRW